MFDVSSLWASGDAKAVEVAEAVEEKAHREQRAEADEASDEVPRHLPKTSPPRPGAGMKRMPSEKPMSESEFVAIERAEKRCAGSALLRCRGELMRLLRFKALNPRGCLDFYLPSEGYNQYLDSLSAHGSYWVRHCICMSCSTGRGLGELTSRRQPRSTTTALPPSVCCRSFRQKRISRELGGRSWVRRTRTAVRVDRCARTLLLDKLSFWRPCSGDVTPAFQILSPARPRMIDTVPLRVLPAPRASRFRLGGLRRSTGSDPPCW